MFELLFSNKLDLHFYSMLEDIFVVLMLYSFLKLIVLGSIVELIWPTQFFNRRNSMCLNSFRLRTYCEFVFKLRYSFLRFSNVIIMKNI